MHAGTVLREEARNLRAVTVAFEQDEGDLVAFKDRRSHPSRFALRGTHLIERESEPVLEVGDPRREIVNRDRDVIDAQRTHTNVALQWRRSALRKTLRTRDMPRPPHPLRSMINLRRWRCFATGGQHSLRGLRVPCIIAPAKTLEEARQIVRDGSSNRSGIPVEGVARYDASALPPAIRWQAPDRPVPLAAAQADMWKVVRVLPTTSLYQIVLVIQVAGAFDEHALASAIDQVVARHDALRMRIVDCDPPVMIAGEPSWHMERIDVERQAGTDADPDEFMQSAIARFRASGCDVRHQPPLRVMLLLREGYAVLGLNLHHIVADAWSLDLIIRDLASAYASAARGIADRRPDAPSFLAYAEDEAHSASSPEMCAATAACVRRIAESKAIPVNLVGDDRRPGMLMSETRIRFDGVTERLDRLAARLGATRFAVVLATLAIAVEARTSNSFPRIAVYTPNRNRPGSELLVGPLGNMILVDIDHRDDGDFAELVQRTMRAVAQGYADDGVPFTRIWSACKDAGLSPSSFMPRFECRWQESPFTTARWGDATVHLLKEPTAPGHSQPTFRLSYSDLIASLTRYGNDLIVELMYKIDVLRQKDVEAFATAFSIALEQGLTDPDQSVSAIVERASAG